MRVFVVNGSPRMEKGNTAKILEPFLEGMKDAGAKIELVYSKRMKINPCIGDFQCWFKKVGECIYNDDMQNVYSRLRSADILVLATPVFIPLPGEMQNFINRLCPIVEPLLRLVNGRTRAHFHEDVKLSKIVLVSSSGWWELGNFDTVIRIVEEIALNTNVEFVGALLRPHASLLTEYPEKAAQVFTAARQAGQQLITNGKISEATLQAISQPLITEEEYRISSNKSYLRVKEI
ncbi:MAG: flavodoxin family protein [Promethearchaeota archaeon]